ncbi:HNH endonuclease family protein [Nocardioides sp. NPDC057772]|uniref:HNH endonuclease family protein n=1 Tax=Nocardioides sp. NPDC057772 TaxID=3346245 RepID=UPI00366BCD23
MGRRTSLGLLVVLLAAVGWAVSLWLPEEAPANRRMPPVATEEPSSSPAPQPVDVRKVRDDLAGLATVARRPDGMAAYERSVFGGGWADSDGNGCNQRDDVLLRDAVEVRTGQQGRCDHDVLAGTWVDPYTGRRLVLTDLKEARQAQAIQIDHVVPLSEAWRSGASRWPEDRRRAFANDLDNLLAVDGPTNMSKGDDDPAGWRPRKGFQCAYATRWIETKARWSLAVDDSERRALSEMLGYC